mgnify:CR=1 FL=1
MKKIMKHRPIYFAAAFLLLLLICTAYNLSYHYITGNPLPPKTLLIMKVKPYALLRQMPGIRIRYINIILQKNRAASQFIWMIKKR